MAKIRLDIILPCFNPPKDWAAELPRTIQNLEKALGPNVETRLILVNDGSARGISPQNIEWLHAQLPRFGYVSFVPNQGKGNALRQGVIASNGDFQIYTDIDFPYTEASFLAIFEELKSGRADIAAGVRNEEYYAHVPPARKFISKVLRWLLRTFLRIKITDTQCGLKGFNAKGRKVFLATTINRFLFDLEFIFLASGMKELNISPIQVELKPGVVFSKARLGILLRESLNFTSILARGIRQRFFPQREA
jgi:glycosyltransferase involved in cell wall biosynthesis